MYKIQLLNRSQERLGSEFLAPNRTWQHDWSVELIQHGHLPATTGLPAKVKKRLLWQLFSDLTYQSQRGRTLERIGKVCLLYTSPSPRDRTRYRMPSSACEKK